MVPFGEGRRPLPGTNGWNEWLPNCEDCGVCDEDGCDGDDECCGRGAGRVEGDETDSEGCWEEEEDEPLPGFWNSFFTSNFADTGVDVDGLADADTDVDADDDGAGLPFTAGNGVDCAVTEPNVLGASDLIGGTEAGEEDNGAEASSIEPKVTAEPANKQMSAKRALNQPTGFETRGRHNGRRHRHASRKAFPSVRTVRMRM